MKPEPIVSIEEARDILGEDAEALTDQQIAEVIGTLDLLAKDTLQKAREKVIMKKDAKKLAELIHDCYQGELGNAGKKQGNNRY